ncbi:MAG: hypothetical protein E5W49_16030, partial [Mesorhizobium sp.]
MAWQSRASSTRQDVEVRPQRFRNAGNAERINAPRSQFDSEHDAVEAAADIGHDRGVGVAQSIASKACRSALDEKLDRSKIQCPCRIQLL